MSIDFSISFQVSPLGIVAEIQLQTVLTDPEFSFYLFKGKERVARVPYSREAAVFFPAERLVAGTYRLSGFVLENSSGNKASRYSENFVIDPRKPLSPPATAPAKRQIRLKEWGVRYDSWKRPAPQYLARTEQLRDSYYRVRTDADGFIVSGKLWTTQSPPEETWAFLGDSFLESLLIPESKRLAATIEDRLNKQGRKIKCLNGGYSGATTLHLTNILINKVIPLAPSCVVLFVPTNDARVLGLSGGYWRDDKIHSPFAPSSSGAEVSGSAYTEHALIGLLELISTVCSHWRIRLILATTPHRHLGYAKDEWLQQRFPAEPSFKKIARKRSAINSQVRKFASLMSLPLIDIEKMAKDYKKYSYDDLHLSENGVSAVADYFLDALSHVEQNA